jgi:glycosyltransferase 2 family protein
MPDYVYGTLGTVAGLALLGVVVWLADPRAAFETLARLEVWQGAVLIATAFGVSLFTALAWRQILLRYGHRQPVSLLFRVTVIAFAAGWAVPSGFVAGLPVAAWLLRRRGVPFSKGLASFSIGRLLEITAYAAALPLALLSAVGSRLAFRSLAIAVIAGVTLVYLDLFLRWHLARRVLGRLRRLLPRPARRPIDAATAFCRDIADFFAGPASLILSAAVYSFAAIAVAFVRALLASEFLELHLGAGEVAVMFAITVFLMAIPFLPGAVGAFEGGIAGAFELLGHSKADGLAYALTVHASELVVVIAGFFLLGHLGIGIVRPGACSAGPVGTAASARGAAAGAGRR